MNNVFKCLLFQRLPKAQRVEGAATPLQHVPKHHCTNVAQRLVPEIDVSDPRRKD